MAREKLSREPAKPAVIWPASKTVRVKEAALILGISENSVRRLIDREKIRTIRALRHHLIPTAELDRFLAGDSN